MTGLLGLKEFKDKLASRVCKDQLDRKESKEIRVIPEIQGRPAIKAILAIQESALLVLLVSVKRVQRVTQDQSVLLALQEQARPETKGKLVLQGRLVPQARLATLVSRATLARLVSAAAQLVQLALLA